MKQSKNLARACFNPDCPLSGEFGKGNIIRHSFYITTQGKGRGYRCKECTTSRFGLDPSEQD